MISDVQVRQLELTLWPQADSRPGSWWTVLDCARNKRVCRESPMSGLDYQCLYSGSIPTELKVVAPHMVELSPRYQFTRSLLQQGWGNCWGIFVRINDATWLRHHLRKLLTVQSEQRRRLLFGCYGPREQRAYLPSCTSDELEQVFAPVSAYFVDGPFGSHRLEAMAFDPPHLSQRSIALSTIWAS